MMRLPCRDLITITERGKVCRAVGLPRRLAIVEALVVREGQSCRSGRFRRSRRYSRAEQVDGFFEPLPLLPEVGPEVALLLEPGKDGFYVVGFRIEVWPQFSSQNRRRDRRLRKCPYGIRGGQRSSMGILLDVDQHAAGGTLRDGSFAGHEIWVLRGNGPRHNLAEGPQLLVGVDGLDRDVQMHSCGAGSLQKTRQAERLQFFLERSSDGYHHREFCTIGRIEIEEKVVGVVEIIQAARPRVLVDTAEPGKKEKGSTIRGGCIVNRFSFFFGFNRRGHKPVRHALAQVLLKKSLALDPVRIATQHQGATT